MTNPTPPEFLTDALVAAAALIREIDDNPKAADVLQQLDDAIESAPMLQTYRVRVDDIVVYEAEFVAANADDAEILAQAAMEEHGLEGAFETVDSSRENWRVF